MSAEKPLGGKAYGSIGHLPGSRRGPGDHGVNAGQERICTAKARDKHDVIVVQEKLDGSCVAVLRQGDSIIPLIRAGYPAVSSTHEQHRLFHDWALSKLERFLTVLKDGERLCGEWLAYAHGTRYDLSWREPFVAFDLILGGRREPYKEFGSRVAGNFAMAHLLGVGPPMTVEQALTRLGPLGFYGALETVEGAVWRVERKGKVDFLAKYVRPEKVDGKYFPNISGQPEVWNWRPPGQS